MPMFINSNPASLNSQRHLARTGAKMSQVFERLSSGLRINSAADDAAGLAISSRMGAQVRSLGASVRNANDGISLLQTAESALSESANILERMRELAVQATNDTNTGSDRASIQTEITQLVQELDRIAGDTEFNTLKLLDGTYASKEIHVGFKSGQTITVSVDDARSTAIGATAKTGTTSTVDTSNLDAGDLKINGVDVGASTGSSAKDKAFTINAALGDTGVTATAAATSVTGAATVSPGAIAAGELTINGVDVGAVTVQNNDSDGSLVAAINAVSASSGVTATLDSANKVVLTAADGRDIVVASGNGDVESGLGSATTTSTIALSSNKDFSVAGANSAARIGVAAQKFSVDAAANGTISTISVTSKSSANSALGIIDSAIDGVSDSRSNLGSLQNRLESTVSNLGAVVENLSAARSRIRDADFAMETAELTRAQIVQQAGVSMLAQANAAPQVVLALLS